MATANAQRLTRESPFSSPTIRRFQSEQSLSARVRGGRIGPKTANDNDSVLTRADLGEDYSADIYQTSGQESTEEKPSFIGKQAKFRIALVLCSIFVGTQSLFALMAAGLLVILPISFTLWLIACLASLAGFTVIRIVLGVSVFENPGLALCTVCAVILSLIPILNIVPWMAGWVWGIYLSGNIR